jgi:hypothetical protein
MRGRQRNLRRCVSFSATVSNWPLMTSNISGQFKRKQAGNPDLIAGLGLRPSGGGRAQAGGSAKRQARKHRGSSRLREDATAGKPKLQYLRDIEGGRGLPHSMTLPPSSKALWRTRARGGETRVGESNILCNYFLTGRGSMRGWGHRADCVRSRFRRRAERFRLRPRGYGGQDGGLRVL